MGFFDFFKKTEVKKNGIWFFKKRKAVPFDKEQFKEAFKEVAPEVYKTLQAQNSLNPFASDSFIEKAAALYDWFSYSGGIDGVVMANGVGQQFFSGVTPDGNWIPASSTQTTAVTPAPGDFGNLKVPAKDAPVAKKPKEVRNELETIPVPWTLKDLDAKIAVMKDKESLTIQRYANGEITGMIDRLQNRKKYDSVKSFFELFPNTTDEKIEDLIKKYPHLRLGTTDLFVPEFPDDAVKAMKEYTQHCKDLCNKKPVFYVIAQKKDFEQKIKRRDPILLVQSPFGMYWQILGAWDEEMVLLSEL